RACARWPAGLMSAASSSSPVSRVIDDVPTFTTANPLAVARLTSARSRPCGPGRSGPASLLASASPSLGSREALFVCELDPGDAHYVAVGRAGARQCALHTHARESLLHVRHRFGIREVGERNRAFCRPPAHAPLVRALSHDRET